jgi:hypothetical protein
MRNAMCTALFVAAGFTIAGATIAGAQPQQPPPERQERPAARATARERQRPAQEKRDRTSRTVVTLTGCVERGQTPTEFTLSDPENGRYEVSGNDIQKYVGRRVQVAGTPGSTRFRIKGGLWPTPNVAAQAGSIDPAKAAIAAQPGGPSSGTGDIGLPTFKVKAIRTLDQGCE